MFHQSMLWALTMHQQTDPQLEEKHLYMDWKMDQNSQTLEVK